MHLETMNAASRDGAASSQARTTPPVDPTAWAGQLEIVEDPYVARADRKIETGFRGRKIHAVRDQPAKSKESR